MPCVGVEQAIRRGIDLIEKYSVAPTVDALEKLLNDRIASTPKAPSWRCHSSPPLASWGRLSLASPDSWPRSLLCAPQTAHALGTRAGRAAEPHRARIGLSGRLQCQCGREARPKSPISWRSTPGRRSSSSSLLGAARLLGRTSSVQVGASTSNPPISEISEVGEVASTTTRETGGD